ncbi:MAG: DUF4982 domain-containing protein [Bacteroidales bacterium]|jgi:beta-galactosidase|nr:DUF4982 domain-containing protein [Bacteroidales bacterium]MCI2121658.1 DUF4982 domain-containing protein [Bacteroidales bacterium]MCI2144972.1 DUF4982 domain-containing protein [Bacteroidales bacterium]
MKSKFSKLFIFALLLVSPVACAGRDTDTIPLRSEILLTEWHFTRGDFTPEEAAENYRQWKEVTVPHDWAISGPFVEKFDGSYAAGTGGLPYVGRGCYVTVIDIGAEDIAAGKSWTLLFDGAMSNARVYVDGNLAMSRPYGYSSFYGDITKYLHEGQNLVLVRLENEPESSRWYPGAGIYRNVHLICTGKLHIPVWGTYATTPFVSEDEATVTLKIEIRNDSSSKAGSRRAYRIRTVIRDAGGKEVAVKDDVLPVFHDSSATQNFDILRPRLWSPDSPCLYTAETLLYDGNGDPADRYVTRFGIRKAEFIPDKGFFLNGKPIKFKGVCLHHDLGALGAATNESAIRHRLEMLKDMGCNAIRTSHNMPAPELVELADEMGFMMMVEAFDEWDIAKCRNGYHKFFKDWAAKDMEDMVRHYRNDPSVMIWSIGNEVPSQGTSDGYETAVFLRDICHREDPSRPVTSGEDHFDDVVGNGFAAVLDIPGFNYKPRRYEEAYAKLPQGFLLSTESASTVSSRNVYELPFKIGGDIKHGDRQSSSYDDEYCPWSNLPELDFAADEDYPWCMGQFVWTGFDYIGEPTPYNGFKDGWPNHTSLFGIIDLAEIPKDRYYLYRSVWNTRERTLHILPHWNWKGHEDRTVPVCIYTSYPAAELFLNGESQGIRVKKSAREAGVGSPIDSLILRYRLLWPDVKYEAGELKAVALDEDMRPVDSAFVRTAGRPHHLRLSVSRPVLEPDGKDLSYVTVDCVDKDGNLCPLDGRLVSVDVTGAGTLEGIANGDPTCLESFKGDSMHLFGGQLTFIVRSSEKEGTVFVVVKAKGVRRASVSILVRRIEKPRKYKIYY